MSRLPIITAITNMAMPIEAIIPVCLTTATMAEAAPRSLGDTDDIIAVVFGALNTAFPSPKNTSAAITNGRSSSIGSAIMSRMPAPLMATPKVGSSLLSSILSYSFPKNAVRDVCTRGCENITKPASADVSAPMV